MQLSSRPPSRGRKAWLFLLALLLAATSGTSQTTALDRYVAEADAAYSFRVVASTPGLGYTSHVLEMTSQTWRTAAEVDQPVWRHWLTIVIPGSVRTSTAILLIDGGSNGGPAPTAASLELGAAAVATGAILAELQMVPNQPLKFADETRTRSEDAFIAYTWDKFLRTGDERWPAQLPMTKAAVRAMDTATAFCRTAAAGAYSVDKFVVVGASKRGWTTWLAAAVDPRVVAAVPLVIDVLNLVPSFLHHWQAYGFWAPAVQDYEEAGVMAWLGTAPVRSLQALVDPYAYRARYTMPKYIVAASGDEFFLPDSSRFYFDDLPGQKYLRYVPNSGHGLDNPDVLLSALAFFQQVTAGASLPQFSWEFAADGAIRLNAGSQPLEVRLWQAANPAARDFRVETIGRAWTSSLLLPSSPGVFEARVAQPAQGWTAYFIEATYLAGSLPLKLTTAIRVAPDTLPFQTPLGAVSAANYVPLAAAEGIASGFGQNLSAATQTAASLPLPENLAGCSVRLTDSKGVGRLAPLFFVSAGQVNFQVPGGSATGLARVEVIRDGQVVNRGQTVIEEYAPALFSANEDGRGIAAGLAVTRTAAGTESIRAIFEASAPPGARTGVPVDLGAAGDQVYLSLFGTGMRRTTAPATATIGGQAVQVVGPLPHSQFVGLDQLNLGPLPRSLAGKGEVSILLTVGGKAANPVTVLIR